MRKLDKCVLRGDWIKGDVLKGLSFAGVEVELVEDGIVQVSDGRIGEQLEGGREWFREGESVAAVHGSYINNQTLTEHLNTILYLFYCIKQVDLIIWICFHQT
jgi:hypothetical protein